MWPYLKADLDSGKLDKAQAQKLLEKFSKQLDALMEAKEKEIMTV